MPSSAAALMIFTGSADIANPSNTRHDTPDAAGLRIPYQRMVDSSQRFVTASCRSTWIKSHSPAALPRRSSRPCRHRARRSGCAQRLCEPRELAEQRAGLARIDDLLDPELLGRTKRRAQPVQPLLDLLQLRLGIGSGIDLGAVGSLDAAFQRQRAPIG